MVKNTIYMWSITRCVDGIYIRGYIRVSNNNVSYMPFSTSHVIERVDSKRIRTFNGSLYQLHGNLNSNKTQLNRIPRRIYKYFSHGFPPNWKDIILSDEFQTLVEIGGAQPNESGLVDMMTERNLTLPPSSSNDGVPHVVERPQEIVEEATDESLVDKEISPMDLTSVATSEDYPLDPLIYGPPSSAGLHAIDRPILIPSYKNTYERLSNQPDISQQVFSSEDDDDEVYLDPIIYGPRSGCGSMKIKESDWEKSQAMRDKTTSAEHSIYMSLNSSATEEPLPLIDGTSTTRSDNIDPIIFGPPSGSAAIKIREKDVTDKQLLLPVGKTVSDVIKKSPNVKSTVRRGNTSKSGSKKSSKSGKCQLNSKDSVDGALSSSSSTTEKPLQRNGDISASGSSSYLDPIIFGPSSCSATNTIKIREKDVVNRQLLLPVDKTVGDVIKELSTRRRGNASKSRMDKENVDIDDLDPSEVLMKSKKSKQREDEPITTDVGVMNPEQSTKTRSVKKVANKSRLPQGSFNPPFNSSRLSTKSKNTTTLYDDDDIMEAASSPPPVKQTSIKADAGSARSVKKAGGRRKRKIDAEISSDDNVIMTEDTRVKLPSSGRIPTKQRSTSNSMTEDDVVPAPSSSKKVRTRRQRRKVVTESSDDNVEVEPPKAATKPTRKGGKKLTNDDVIVEELDASPVKSPTTKPMETDVAPNISVKKVRTRRQRRKFVTESSDDDVEVEPPKAATKPARKGDNNKDDVIIVESASRVKSPTIKQISVKADVDSSVKKGGGRIQRVVSAEIRSCDDVHKKTSPLHEDGDVKESPNESITSDLMTDPLVNSIMHENDTTPTKRGREATSMKDNTNNIVQQQHENFLDVSLSSIACSTYQESLLPHHNLPSSNIVGPYFSTPLTKRRRNNNIINKPPQRNTPSMQQNPSEADVAASEADVAASPAVTRMRLAREYTKDGDDHDNVKAFAKPLGKRSGTSNQKQQQSPVKTTDPPVSTRNNRKRANKNNDDVCTVEDDNAVPSPPLPKNKRQTTKKAVASSAKSAKVASKKATTTRRKLVARKGKVQTDEEEEVQPSKSTKKQKTQIREEEAAPITSKKATTRRKPAVRKTTNEQPSSAVGRKTRAASKQPIDLPQTTATTKKGGNKAAKGGRKLLESDVEGAPQSTTTGKGGKKATAKKKPPPPTKKAATLKTKKKTTFAPVDTKKSKKKQKLEEEKRKTKEMAAQITDALKVLTPRTPRRVSGQDFYQDIPDMAMFGEDDTIPEVPTTASSVLSTPNSSRAGSERDLLSFTSSDQSSNFNFDAVARVSPEKARRTGHKKSEAFKADRSRAERVVKRVMNDRKKLKKGGARLKSSPAPKQTSKSRGKRSEFVNADMFKSAEDDDDDDDDEYFW